MANESETPLDTVGLDGQERDELRRLAYGRPGSPADAARAAQAFERLNELDAAELAERTVRAEQAARANAAAARNLATSVSTVATSHSAASGVDVPVDDQDDADGLPARPTRRWALPVLAAGLVVVGAVVGLLAGGANAQTPLAAPSATPTAEPETLTARQFQIELNGEGLPTAAVGGDLRAAERWLATTPEAADLLTSNMGRLDLGSTRLVQRNLGPSPWNLYVGKGTNGDLCLVVTDPDQTPQFSSCTSQYDFGWVGLTLNVNDKSVSWDGSQIVTTLRHG
ncbi:hypothetical protein [Glaciibacter psychrotolerans]|uniref:Uncharacterized protein n=1 Tax=Glaciibacter psychrotolerans TaxID=670054 RepID=A0A7Z0J622_9MICO|nr:hypothetical protein [Leifsonia psychrotolerans]NYJ20092.1 hypothetical protein [Leifsonia psychrotolerans]